MNNETDLNCPICLDLLLEPCVHASCGNMFCHDCIVDVDKCPMCREILVWNPTNLMPVVVRTILSAISDIHFKCPDCHQKVLRIGEKVHPSDCRLKCKDCGLEYLKSNERQHYENECLVICQMCKIKVNSDMESHVLNDCEFREVSCYASTDGCEWKGKVNERVFHESECKLAICRRKYNKDKQLFAIKCPETGKYLTYQDGKVFPSDDPTNRLWFYLENKESTCPVDAILNSIMTFRIKTVFNDGREFYLERSVVDNNVSYLMSAKWGFELGLFKEPTQYWAARYSKDKAKVVLTTDDDLNLIIIGENTIAKSRDNNIPNRFVFGQTVVYTVDYRIGTYSNELDNVKIVYPVRIKSKDIIVYKQ